MVTPRAQLPATPKHRVLRRLLKTLAWLLGVPVALVALVSLALFLALAVPSARTAVTRYGLSYAADSFGYEVTIGRVDRFDPWAIELHDVHVVDPEQHDLGTVGELSLRLRPLALLQQTLHVTRARLAHVRGRYDLEALLAAPAEPESEDQSPSTFVVQVDLLRVLDTQLVTPWSGRQLAATIDVLEGGGRWSQAPRVALNEARLRVEADSGGAQGQNKLELLRLTAPRGTWSAEGGGSVALTGALAGSPLAVSAKFGPLEGAPWPIEKLDMKLADFGHEALQRLGLDQMFDLRAPLALEAHAETAGEDVKLRAELRAPEGAVLLEASANLGSAQAELRVEPILLSAVSPSLPTMRVQGNLSAQANYSQKAIPISLGWQQVRVDAQEVPDGRARALLDLPRVRLESLSLRELGSQLALHGAYDTDTGAADATLALDHLRLEALEILRVQKLAGELDGKVEFALRAQGGVEGKVQLTGARIVASGSKLESLSLAATVAGSMTRPRGSLRLELAGLSSGDARFDKVQAEAELSSDTLDGRIDGTGMNASVHADLHGTRAPNGDLTLGASGHGRAVEHALDFELKNLQYGSGNLAVELFSLAVGEQKVTVRGSMRESGPLDADVLLHKIDLASWASLIGRPQLRGGVDGSAKVSGSVQKPAGTLKLAVSKLSVMGEPEADANLQGELDMDKGKFGAKLELHSAGDGLSVQATAGLTTNKRRVPARSARGSNNDLVGAMKNGELEVDGSAHFPASRLLMLGDERISALKGTIDVKLAGKGTMAEPHLALDVAARLQLPAKPSAKTETLQASLKVEPERASLNIELDDDQGKLAHADLSTTFAGGSLQAALAQPDSFKTPQFELHVLLNQRRLDTMQGVYGYLAGAYQVDLPVKVGGKISLASDGQSFDGNAMVRLVVYGDKIDQACVVGSSSTLNLDAELKQGNVQLSVASQGDAAGQAKIEVKTHLDVASLMAGKSDQFERVVATLVTKQVDLSKLPGLCALKSGKADVNLSAALFGNKPLELHSKIDIEDLRGQRGAAFGTHLVLRTTLERAEMKASLSGDLTVDRKPNGRLEASVPLSGDLKAIPSVAPDAAVQARVRFQQLPLSGPLSAVAELGQVGGTASADLSLTGTLAQPKPGGFLELHEVGFTVASLAQPVRHLNGRISIKDRELTVERLSAKDGDGEIKLSGSVKVNDDFTGRGRMHVNADRFPLRQEGTVVGELTLDTEVGAQLVEAGAGAREPSAGAGAGAREPSAGAGAGAREPSAGAGAGAREPSAGAGAGAREPSAGAGAGAREPGAEAPSELIVDVDINRGRMWLTGEQGRDVQQLDPNPDIEFEDLPPEVQADAANTPAESSIVLKSLTIKSHRDMWVMHTDFSVQVALDLTLSQELDGAVMRGDAQITRGELQILGKTFKIQKGNIHFTGDVPPDPDLNLKATYQPPSSQPLNVQVSGLASAPVITFSGAATNMGEAVQLLSGVGRAKSNNSAQQDVSNFATTLTAGLLSVAARRKFGDWVPTLGVETNASGQVNGARAGFDASDIIPEFMRGFARGAYVEGVVGGSSANQTGSVGVGVRLDLSLPRDFVSSMGYGPGTRWSADVLWAP